MELGSWLFIYLLIYTLTYLHGELHSWIKEMKVLIKPYSVKPLDATIYN